MVQDMILVCAGADSVRAKESGLPLLRFGLRLQPNGELSRTLLSGEQNYLGVMDQGMKRFSASVCGQLIAEAERVGAAGMFIDCESRTQAVDEFLCALDRQAERRKLRLFVPLCQAECVTYACLVADTAISGGCLHGYFHELTKQYPGRIAASLRAISRDFLLPSANTEGTPLTTEERNALRAQTGAQPFFSCELCARYFTYMDKENRGHFVLFDDEDTLQAKCRCLQELSVSPVFAKYSDVCTLLPSL